MRLVQKSYTLLPDGSYVSLSELKKAVNDNSKYSLKEFLRGIKDNPESLDNKISLISNPDSREGIPTLKRRLPGRDTRFAKELGDIINDPDYRKFKDNGELTQPLSMHSIGNKIIREHIDKRGYTSQRIYEALNPRDLYSLKEDILGESIYGDGGDDGIIFPANPARRKELEDAYNARNKSWSTGKKATAAALALGIPVAGYAGYKWLKSRKKKKEESDKKFSDSSGGEKKSTKKKSKKSRVLGVAKDVGALTAFGLGMKHLDPYKEGAAIRVPIEKLHGQKIDGVLRSKEMPENNKLWKSIVGEAKDRGLGIMAEPGRRYVGEVPAAGILKKIGITTGEELDKILAKIGVKGNAANTFKDRLKYKSSSADPVKVLDNHVVMDPGVFGPNPAELAKALGHADHLDKFGGGSKIGKLAHSLPALYLSALTGSASRNGVSGFSSGLLSAKLRSQGKKKKKADTVNRLVTYGLPVLGQGAGLVSEFEASRRGYDLLKKNGASPEYLKNARKGFGSALGIHALDAAGNVGMTFLGRQAGKAVGRHLWKEKKKEIEDEVKD